MKHPYRCMAGSNQIKSKPSAQKASSGFTIAFCFSLEKMINDCPWMQKDLKYELDIVALGKYVCACEEIWWKKNVMSIFGRSMPNSQICQIWFWSGRLFHLIRPTECQFNYSSRVASKAFPNAFESQEAKQAPYFCLTATIFTVIDRISTRIHVHTSFSRFVVVYMVK